MCFAENEISSVSTIIPVLANVDSIKKKKKKKPKTNKTKQNKKSLKSKFLNRFIGTVDCRQYRTKSLYLVQNRTYCVDISTICSHHYQQ